MTTGASTGRHAVVTLNIDTWDDFIRRQFARPPDQLARHLIESSDMDKFLLVNPWRGIGSAVKRRLGPRRDAAFPSSRQSHLLRPVRLGTPDPTDPDRLADSYRLYSRLIRARCRTLAMDAPVLMTFNLLLAGFGDHRGFHSVTYIARDDWAATPRLSDYHPAYRAACERIRDRGIRVSAVSQVLLDRIGPTGPGIVVPNAIDPAIWEPERPKPAELKGVVGPVVVYTGTIDERLSLTSLAALQKALPDATLVLVGPVADERTRRAVTDAVGHTLFLGHVGQVKLAELVRAADVCVVPHARTPLTEAMSPLKLYEYLAAGKPVAAVDLAPMRGIHDRVVLCGDDEDFGGAVVAALQLQPMSEVERLDFIRSNTWAARCRRILELASA